MAYTYQGNQLLSVTDSRNGDAGADGFNDINKIGDDYSYDINGNLIRDKNKKIKGITYNYLNLPEEITMNPVGASLPDTVEYVYDATGAKLSKKVNQYPNLTTLHYAGKYLYKSSYNQGLPPGPNNSDAFGLMLINHPEGYVEPESDGSFKYVYQYKDHLGNIRLSYADKDKDGKIDLVRNGVDLDGDGDYAQEILEENNYYPFGLKHKGYNNTIIGREDHYKFNGKELQKELGLNWYDFGSRNYNPEIGRWMNIDPLADHSNQIGKSPYNSFWNNPIVFNDPSGLCPKCPSPDEYDIGETYKDRDGVNWHLDRDRQWAWNGGSLEEVWLEGNGASLGDYEDEGYDYGSTIGEFDEDTPDWIHNLEVDYWETSFQGDLSDYNRRYNTNYTDDNLYAQYYYREFYKPELSELRASIYEGTGNTAELIMDVGSAIVPIGEVVIGGKLIYMGLTKIPKTAIQGMRVFRVAGSSAKTLRSSVYFTKIFRSWGINSLPKGIRLPTVLTPFTRGRGKYAHTLGTFFGRNSAAIGAGLTTDGTRRLFGMFND